MGDFEGGALASLESSVRYHPVHFLCLTAKVNHLLEHCMMGSLAGAAASQRVTEAYEGRLRMVGHHPLECNGKSLPDCKTDKSSRDESRS